MGNLAYRSAKQLASLIRQKKVGCLELLNHYLERIESYNARINAVIFMDIKAARKRARAADRALAKGEMWGPLHGVPMTVKESFDIVGMPSTWGVPEYRDNYPKKNAVVVDRLCTAGAVIFGKTNGDGERQAAAFNDPNVLGRILLQLLPAVYGGTDWIGC
jgi:amidase